MSFDHIEMNILPNDFIYRTKYEKYIAPRISNISEKCIHKTETFCKHYKTGGRFLLLLPHLLTIEKIYSVYNIRKNLT